MICLSKPEVEITQLNKFATFVYVVRGNLCSKFFLKQTNFDKITIKRLKIPMDPSSQTWEWLPSVLILRGLWGEDKHKVSSKTAIKQYKYANVCNLCALLHTTASTFCGMVKMCIGNVSSIKKMHIWTDVSGKIGTKGRYARYLFTI